MSKEQVRYIAVCSEEYSPGILKKIQGFTNAANYLGHTAVYDAIDPTSKRKIAKFILTLIRARNKVVIVRYQVNIGILFFFLGLLYRLRNQKLIIDVPTPTINFLYDINHHEKSLYLKRLHQLYIMAVGFWPYLSAHRIIQYSTESKYFEYGSKNRKILIGNSVDTNSIEPKKEIQDWPGKELRLIALGMVSTWHGWDYLIKSIYLIKLKKIKDFTIRLKIIGNGPDESNLKSLTKELNLEDQITFLPNTTGKRLKEHLYWAHLGVGSLGWHRANIKLASPLKYREYLAYGLPFFYITDDVDLKSDCKVAYQLQNHSDLVQFLIKLKEINLPSPHSCRSFAERKLDYRVKIKSILKDLI